MKPILLLLATLLTLCSFAQNLSYSISPTFKIKDEASTFIRAGNTVIRYEINSGPMQMAYTAKLARVRYDITLHKYDAKMQESETVKLGDDKTSFGPFRPYLFTYMGTLHVLYYQYLDGDVIKLYLAQVSADALKISKTTELCSFNQKNVGIFNMADAIQSNKIRATASPDGTKVLVVHSNTEQIRTFLINEDLAVVKSVDMPTPDLKGFNLTSIMLDNNGNKYFAYDYTEDKENRRGLIIDNNNVKPKLQPYRLNQGGYDANSLSFAASQDGKQVYMYANYYQDQQNEGIFLATISPENAEVSKAELYPYPDAFKEQLLNGDFANKRKGSITVNKIYYSFSTLSNGTITLNGVPSYSSSNTTSRGYSMTNYYAGPVVSVFISPQKKAVFTMIPRNLSASAAAGPHEALYIPMNDKLMCVYADKERNLDVGITDKPYTNTLASEMILIAATYDSNGTLLSRKKIADKPGSSNYFMLDENFSIGNRLFLLPVGRQRVSMVKYYTEYEQLATLELKQ